MADLVTVDWLADNLGADHIKILDCTWVMPDEDAALPQGYIPSAQYFDIDVVADLSSPMTHMLSSGDMFSSAVSEMGIRNTDHVICYDRHGVRASPRVWWNFKAFGHETVSILDGGLPSWISADKAISHNMHSPDEVSDFKIKSPLLKVADSKFVMESIHTNYQIVDARPSGRFYGTTPEPRKGLRSGHIPGSFSLPFGTLKQDDGRFLPLTGLAERVGNAGIDLNNPIITSCGSGVTAAGIAHVLHRLGAKDITLYDGSWIEWGASDLPVGI